jgi:pre-60S factor REI1
VRSVLVFEVGALSYHSQRQASDVIIGQVFIEPIEASMADFVDLESTFKCNTCKSCFASTEKIKEHYKGEWHILNSKRRANGLIPLKRSEYKDLVAQQGGKKSNSSVASSVAGDVKSPKKQEVEILDTVGEEGEEGAESAEEEEETEPEPPKIAANISIFDDKEFNTTEECVNYMATKFGFFIPDAEYLVDLDGLLEYLGEKVKLGGYCLYCQKIFAPGKACQNHMTSKSHCKLRYENGIDGEEFEDFYDFSASYEDVDDVEFDEDGNVLAGGPEIASTGEMVLADGRILGHRDFRVYYKQHYRPADTREPVLAAQREELLRLGGKFGGMKFDSEEVERMEDMQVMAMLVRYQKEVRKGMMVEQRAQLSKDFRNQRQEYKSKVQKMRSSEITTAKIRDYHGMLK